MRKEDEDEYENNDIKNDLNFKTVDNNTLSRNVEYDNDQETDDILTKLDNLSQSSDDKSFDSPIIFNRTKTFFNHYKTDIKKLLSQSFTINENNYNNNNPKVLEKLSTSTNKKFQKVSRIKSSLNIKTNNNNNNVVNKKITNFNRELKKSTSVGKMPEITRYHSINNIRNYNNKIFCNKLPSINENINENKNYDNENELGDIINKKIENIISIKKDIKYIDNKIKKDLNNIMDIINKEISNNKLLQPINELLDFIIDILNTVKNTKDKNSNNNKVGNEKIILKLQNELKEKDKEIGEIINKMNSEKNKLENSFKSNNTELLNLRKQNKDLTNKILNLQKQIAKLVSNNEILEEKLNKIILEKTSKIMNSSTSVKSTFIGTIEPPSLDTSFMTQKTLPSNDNIKNNTQKLNEKYNISKKLNLNLIDLLKEINNMLCYYDSFLNKECGANKNVSHLIKNMTSFMDINNLNEDKKMKNVANEYMRNMEIIFKKLEEYIKGVNDNNNSEIKHSLTMKHSSCKILIKKDNNKDNNKKILVNRNNGTNIPKNMKNSNNTNSSIPTRKRTNTINYQTPKPQYNK